MPRIIFSIKISSFYETISFFMISILGWQNSLQITISWYTFFKFENEYWWIKFVNHTYFYWTFYFMLVIIHHEITIQYGCPNFALLLKGRYSLEISTNWYMERGRVMLCFKWYSYWSLFFHFSCLFLYIFLKQK